MAINPHIQSHRVLIERFKQPPGDASGFVTDDFSWSDQEIIFELLSIRASVAQMYLDTGKDLSTQMVQILPCVALRESDVNECPCTPPSGCYWQKSELPLPKYIKIVSVTGTSVNEDMPTFNHKRWEDLKYVPKARTRAEREGLFWTKRDTGQGTFLYLYGNTFLESVTVAGIWENPMEAAAYPSCGKPNKEALCNPLDVSFYTDTKMTDTILSMAWSKLLPVKQQAPADVKNNDNSRL